MTDEAPLADIGIRLPANWFVLPTGKMPTPTAVLSSGAELALQLVREIAGQGAAFTAFGQVAIPDAGPLGAAVCIGATAGDPDTAVMESVAAQEASAEIQSSVELSYMTFPALGDCLKTTRQFSLAGQHVVLSEYFFGDDGAEGTAVVACSLVGARANDFADLANDLVALIGSTAAPSVASEQ